jgi:hypothetical protein
MGDDLRFALVPNSRQIHSYASHPNIREDAPDAKKKSKVAVPYYFNLANALKTMKTEKMNSEIVSSPLGDEKSVDSSMANSLFDRNSQNNVEEYIRSVADETETSVRGNDIFEPFVFDESLFPVQVVNTSWVIHRQLRFYVPIFFFSTDT